MNRQLKAHYCSIGYRFFHWIILLILLTLKMLRVKGTPEKGLEIAGIKPVITAQSPE